MSGGSYGYFYQRVNEFLSDMKADSPLRKAFKSHLVKVSKACHDIEWVDSSDFALGHESEAIKACLGTDAHALVLSEIMAEAVRVKSELEQAIDQAEKGKV